MSPSEVKAVIFDLDGTLVNTAFLHKEAWEIALSKLGMKASVDVTLLLGRRSADIARILAGEKWEELLRVKNEVFLDIVKRKAEALPCAVELVNKLRREGKKVAVVTSSNRLSATNVLKKAGIEQDCLITGDDVSKGKPDPEPILKALDCLHVLPSEAIAVGDTSVDLLAYRAAGVRAIYLVRSGVPVSEEVKKEAGAIDVENLCELERILEGAEGGI